MRSILNISVIGLAAIFAMYAGIISAHADVVISNKPTQDMACDSGVCTATAKKAVMNASDLANMLASDDVIVKSGIAKSIRVDQLLSWESTSRLTFEVNQYITVNKPISVAGGGALTITYGGSGSDGDLQFFGKGKIDFLSGGGSLIINGHPYVLAYDVTSLAAAVAKDTSGNFALAADYDATNEFYDDSPVPIFNGTFEGLGHTISHLNIKERVRGADAGFFGQSGGVIRDVTLESINLSVAKGGSGGAIAGFNAGLIAHVHARGKISAKDRVTSLVGGLVGENGNGFGGGTITNSSANVSGQIYGGLVGLNHSIIDQCFAEGKVTAPGGGLVGELFSGGKISNSYASGPLTAGIGGFIGVGDLEVSSSYSIGQVAQSNFSGGFVGQVDSNAVQNAYWDVDTSGQTEGCGSGDCSGITGLSDAQLKSGMPAGFDPKIWAQDTKINSGYPYLRANPPR